MMKPAMKMLLLTSRKGEDEGGNTERENRMNYGAADYRQKDERSRERRSEYNRYESGRYEYGEGGESENRLNYPREPEYRRTYNGGEYNTHRRQPEWDDPNMTYDDPDSRFRDRRGREHYDNGRYAPRNDTPDENNNRMPSDPPWYQPMNRIGFVTDPEITPNYKTTVGYDRIQDMTPQPMSSERIAGHGSTSGNARMDKDTAMMWMQSLENEDGTKGAHWTMEQAKQVMAQHSIECDPLEFYVALNIMYSDYGKILKKHGVGDKISVYADMAKAFLDDKDAVPNKLEQYYNTVVKH